MTKKVLVTGLLVLLVTVVFACILVFFYWSSLGPPLRVVSEGQRLVVDVQTLGEYPTVLTRVRITDLKRNAVVWEVSALNQPIDVHKFELFPGENSAKLAGRGEEPDVLTPSGAVFVLERDRPYRLEVWGASGKRTMTRFSF